MKKKIAAAVTALTVAASAGIPAFASEHKSLLVLGDSIGTGYALEGYKAGDNKSAKDSFANKLAADFESYENLAKDASTSADLLEKVSDPETRKSIKNADTIVISIGGNDFIIPFVTGIQVSLMTDPDVMAAFQSGNFSPDDLKDKLSADMLINVFDKAMTMVDVDASSKNITDIIDTINGVNDDCEIYILTVENPFGGLYDTVAGEIEDPDDVQKFSDALDSLGGLSKSYNDSVISIAGTYDNVYAVDVYSAFSGREAELTNIGDMDIHPNKAGHALIYELVSEAIASNASSAPASEPEAPAAEPETPATEPAPAPAPSSDSASSSADTGNTSAVTLSFTAAFSLIAAAFTAKKRNKY